jgi:DNA-directed RNA polymerase subunit beta
MPFQNQVMSVGTSLIPFLEHDDGNRLLMGSNMQRQALMLQQSEFPLVQTETERFLPLDAQSTLISRKSSKVIYVSSNKIVLRCSILNSYYKKWSSNKKKIKTKSLDKVFFISNFRKSNQNTCIHQNFVVNTTDWVKKGQIIAHGLGVSKGFLSLGKNLLIGYVAWNGFNFEDAIVINESLRNNDLFTSFSLKSFRVLLFQNSTEEIYLTRYVPDSRLISIKNLKKNGLIKIGAFVKKDDILLGQIKLKKLNNSLSRLLINFFHDKFIFNTSIKIPKNISGFVTKIKFTKKKGIISLVVFVKQSLRIDVGDKLSGRHGNKGIISNIVPLQDMPFLPDGTSFDILLSPLGIPSRMNVGQIFECMLGLAAINLFERYTVFSFDERQTNNQISKHLVYNKLYKAKILTKKNWLFNYNSPGKLKVFDGFSGVSYLQPILAGYSYILKLMHLVSDKINSRSIGSYSAITKQPLRGKSKQGGQRMGEMEIWALEGFGAAYTLHEMISIKSDDLIIRSRSLISLILGVNIKQSSFPETLKILVLELQSLGLNVTIYNKSLRFFN